MSVQNQLRTEPWQKVYDELGVSIPPFDNGSLGSHVEKHAVNISDKPALQYFDRSISYAELNAESNKLANALIKLGVTKGDVIGFHMPNIPQYAIALVAATKLGCAGSGVSPLMTASELQYQIEDSSMTVLISLDSLIEAAVAKIPALPDCLQHVISASAADYLAPTQAELLELAPAKSHSFLDLIEAEDSTFSQIEIDGDSTMMVQYTGGTTGRPKGAELTVNNLMYNPLQYSVYKPWEEGVEVVNTGFPLFHGAGLAFVTTALRFGGLFILIPDPRDLDFICKQLHRFPPTRLAAVPSLYQMLLNHPSFKEVDFSRLKIASTGAAPMSSQDRVNIENVIGEGKISDMFGMTETGPVHVCNPPGRSKPASVGIPVLGAETRIVDLETGKNEMPVGEAGEIITAGPQVMKGYLNLPEESAQALRQWRGKTWMYTGDVGYTDEEGYIYLCDRAKDMLIVGGYKVFSVEVEDKLQALPFIALSAVIGEADEQRPGNDIVNLYVELTPQVREQESYTDDYDQIRQSIVEYCREVMAPYKVPKKIHIVDAIPLTSVGKIDKKALRASQLHN